MPRFDPYGQTLLLKFEGTRFDGAEVEVRLNLSLQDYLEFVTHTRLEEELRFLFAHDQVVAWNFERDGEPVPVTVEEALKLPMALSRQIVMTWSQAGLSPDVPFAQPSRNGATSEEPETATAT